MKRTKQHFMINNTYFAVFDPAEEGGYNVSFPDFPGCVTFGGTFEEAKAKAREVLELWVEELLSTQTEAIPFRASRPIITVLSFHVSAGAT